MSTIPGTLPSAQPPTVKPFKKTLDQSDFLALMSAQLKNQDPTKPVDNTEYVAQMAQFSSLAGISETNTTLQKISEQLTAQTKLLQDIKAATPAPPAT